MDCFSVANVKNVGKDGSLLFTISTECFLLSVMVIEHKHTLHFSDTER